MSAPDWLAGGTYIALGGAAALALPLIWTNVGVAATVLIVIGGIFYIAGARGYYRRRPDPAAPRGSLGVETGALHANPPPRPSPVQGG